MAGKVRRTKKKDDIFFNVFASTSSVERACELSGYSSSSVYRYKASDVEFSYKWEIAVKQTVSAVEGSLFDLAVNGDKDFKSLKYVDSEGKACHSLIPIKRRNPAAMQLFLKAHAPEKYNDRLVVAKLEPLANDDAEGLSDEDIQEELDRFDDLKRFELEREYPGITQIVDDYKNSFND
ncbi:hypothetical protein [Photobacterium indicum]|uniref:hypothetical protein n=1 Tax=Photobacterium indicum TaxID=81447 RepID=UPI003D135478